MEWKAKIRSQLKAFKDKHVVELPHACTAEELADWLSNKGKASNQAISKTIYLLRKSKHNDHLSEDDIRSFVGALQYNVVFNMGSKVSGHLKKEKVNCYCPCRSYMKPWREQFVLNGISGRGDTGFFQLCTVKLRVSPCELIDHLGLDTLKKCPLHFGVKAYVFALYKN